jgi:hypothetical protein
MAFWSWIWAFEGSDLINDFLGEVHSASAKIESNCAILDVDNLGQGVHDTDSIVPSIGVSSSIAMDNVYGNAFLQGDLNITMPGGTFDITSSLHSYNEEIWALLVSGVWRRQKALSTTGAFGGELSSRAFTALPLDSELAMRARSRC